MNLNKILSKQKLWSLHHISSRSITLLPNQAQVVIVGSGVVANSVAYHLVENGWKDIVLLEQDSLGSGTSSFGSGTLGLFKPIDERNIVSYSIKLYKKLQSEGHNLNIEQVGSINLAQTKDRMIALRRRMAFNLPTGLNCELVSPNEIKKLHPHINVTDIEGGVWVPDDCIGNPQAIGRTLASLAEKGGARYFEQCHVSEVHTSNGRVYGVQTNQGFIKCEFFVNCAGMWSRELGWLCNPKVRIPIYPAQHFYVTTDSVAPGVAAPGPPLPYIRDYDSYTYIREFGSRGGFMVGGFEPDAKPAFVGLQKIPRNWRKHCPPDWKHFAPLWERALHRLPALENVTKPVLHNSPDTFTPNGKWILGETPEVRNYFVAVGMNGNSLQGAGGIGRAVAEWMTHGEATQELLSFDVQRFLDLHNNRQYLQQRIREVAGRHYAIQYPHQCEFKYARNLRCSPLYSVLETRGAVFGVRMGYERPLYFDTNYRVGDPRPEMPPGTFFKPKFFDFMQEEYQACFEGVGIIDMSSFSKIKITCSDETLVDWLQQLCSNDVNIAVGGISHTGMQNERGGYENDCILVRETENSYFMVSPTSQQTRVFEWMRNHLPTKHSITMSDVTSKYTVINVVGPKAKQLLSELCDEDINLHPFSYKRADIGYASDVKLMGFTHTGEPGYCLYIPSEYALHVYQRMMTLGADYNARDVGGFTQRYMRIEKFIPFWAEDLNSVTTPFESGSAYRVKLDKDYFIGKAALQRQKEKGVQKRLVMFVAEDLDPDTDVWLWGSEPIYRNDQFVGTITSAGYGFTMKKLIGLGYIRHPEGLNVTNEFVTEGAYTLDVAGKRFKASAHIYPPLSNVQVARPYIPQVVNKIIG